MSNVSIGRRSLITIFVVAVLAAAGVAVATMSSPAGARPTGRAAADTSCAAGTTVPTASGPICGLVSQGTKEWLGIPYAAPPVGALRWQPPQPHAPWTTTLPAVQYGPGCPTPGPDAAAATEDCLDLNVVAPQNAGGGPLPVMVWIHGGGFGGGASNQFPGLHLAQAGHVVFVAMDYRLGLLGFLATRAFGRHAGDYGLEDQQAALRWVNDNIAAFGGDPHNVTIFGESAGGSSVCDQLVSPTASGLFTKAISQSGFYNSVTGVNTFFQPQDCKSNLPTESQADTSGQAFATSVGCTDPATLADCLRKLPLSTLLAQPGSLTGPTNSPIINGTTLTTDAQRAFASGRFNRVPTVMGTLRDEDLIALPTTPAQFNDTVQSQYGADAGAVLAAYPLDRYATPYLAFRTLVADSNTVCPALRSERGSLGGRMSTPTRSTTPTHRC